MQTLKAMVCLSEQVWLSYPWHFHEGLIIFLSFLRVTVGAVMISCHPFFLAIVLVKEIDQLCRTGLSASWRIISLLPLSLYYMKADSPTALIKSKLIILGWNIIIHRYKIIVCCTFCKAKFC